MPLRIVLIFNLLVALCLPLFSQKYDAVILEYNTQCKVEPSAVVYDVRNVIQINNRNGDDYSVIVIPCSKDLKVSNIEGRIEDASGKVIRELKKSEIIDQNEITGDLYNDRYLKIFQLKHNSYPYKIIYSYTHTKRNYMHIIDWTPVRSKKIPTLKAELQVNIPLDLKYKMRSESITNHSIDTLGSIVNLLFESSYPTPVKEESYTCDNFPNVAIVPMNFTNSLQGSWDSWKDYGEWVHRLNEGLDELPESEKAIVANLIKGKTDKVDIIRTLYHYMQDHTRYINVSIGIGALQTFPAEYVCRNKYGDCKALTNYMKALLKAAGIQSYFTVLELKEFPGKFYTDFPSHQFNHIILMVPVDNDTLWLENTSNLLPMGYVNSNIQNRYGLLIDKENSKLIKMPALLADDVLESKRINYTLDKDGTAKVTMSCIYRGNEFEYFTMLSSLVEQSDRDKKIREIMMFDNYEVTDWKIRKSTRDRAIIFLDVNLKLNKFLNSIGTDQYFALNGIGIPTFTNTGNRTSPVSIPYPVNICDTLVFNLPEGYQLKNQLQPIDIQSSFGSYNLNITSDKNVITAVKSFKLNSGEYGLEAYPDFYKFIEAARKSDKTKIVIRHINL